MTRVIGGLLSFCFALVVLVCVGPYRAMVFGADQVPITDVRQLAGRWEGRLSSNPNPLSWGRRT